MLGLYQSLSITGPLPQGYVSTEVSKFSPEEIREVIASLIAEGNESLADALCEAGLAMYPESQDILAISGLIAMSRSEWKRAVSTFEELLELQIEQPQPYTHLMLIRAMRCEGELVGALNVCIRAHELFPKNVDLEREFEGLTKVLGFAG
ncbi:MAG: hypothetical protein RLZZ290_1236 [Pseudomonadota bacterium]